MKTNSCLKVVKVYKVSLKNNPRISYYVDAPSKRIARWCGAALFNNEHSGFKTDKDMKAEKFTYEEN